MPAATRLLAIAMVVSTAPRWRLASFATICFSHQIPSALYNKVVQPGLRSARNFRKIVATAAVAVGDAAAVAAPVAAATTVIKKLGTVSSMLFRHPAPCRKGHKIKAM